MCHISERVLFTGCSFSLHVLANVTCGQMMKIYLGAHFSWFSRQESLFEVQIFSLTEGKEPSNHVFPPVMVMDFQTWENVA